MRRHAAAVIAGLFFTLTAGLAGAQEILQISVIVNDQVISVHDLEDRLRLVLASSQVPSTTESRRQLRAQVLRSLVDEKLQVQEARRLDIKLTSDEINKAILRLAESISVSPENLDAYLASQNIRLGTVLTRLRAGQTWSKLLALRFAGEVRISDEEIDEVIARLAANKGKTEHLISEIFLSVNNPNEDEEVRRNAARLVSEARRGAPFAAIAEQFSQAATASRGGQAGWVQPGQATVAVEATLRTLKPGGVSDPIHAEGGYYIIKLHDSRKILVDEPLRAIVWLMQILLPVSPAATPEEIASKRRRAASIAGTVKGCEAFQAAIKEVKTLGSGDLGRIRVGDLPAELRDGVAGLEVGQASTPIERRSGIHVLMVCDRSVSTATMPSREQTRRNLRDQRLLLLGRRYLRDLRRDAVIEYR